VGRGPAQAPMGRGRDKKRRKPVSEMLNMEPKKNGKISSRGNQKAASSLISLGLLGEGAKRQCVPVRGVRSDLVASEWPGSIMLNRIWPDTAWRQPPPVGSRNRHHVSRFVRQGRSHTVFYRDLVRSCIVLRNGAIKHPNVDRSSSGREGITRRKAEPMRCKKSDGLIVVMTPWETREEVPLPEGSGGEPKANRLRRGPSLKGAKAWNLIDHMCRVGERCKVCC
jgi:hypothetical protein